MELIQLKYFKTVAQVGKINKAAEMLFISASALSTSISRLENELGVRLFDRTTNRIQLNEQGKIFLQYVNQVFTTLDDARSTLRQNAILKGHHVSFASVMSTQWVDMITAFTQANPHFTLSCTSIKRSELTDRGLPFTFLLAAEDDIPPFYAEKLDYIFLFEDSPMIMVNSEHPLAQKDVVRLDELQNENLFLPLRDYALYDKLISMFAISGIPLPESNSYSMLTAQQMAANGLGIGFTSVHTIRPGSYQLKYIPIDSPNKSWCSNLYWRKNHNFTEDEQTFKMFVESFYSSC